VVRGAWCVVCVGLCRCARLCACARVCGQGTVLLWLQRQLKPRQVRGRAHVARQGGVFRKERTHPRRRRKVRAVCHCLEEGALRGWFRREEAEAKETWPAGIRCYSFWAVGFPLAAAQALCGHSPLLAPISLHAPRPEGCSGSGEFRAILARNTCFRVPAASYIGYCPFQNIRISSQLFLTAAHAHQQNA